MVRKRRQFQVYRDFDPCDLADFQHGDTVYYARLVGAGRVYEDDHLYGPYPVVVADGKTYLVNAGGIRFEAIPETHVGYYKEAADAKPA
jgi:hypothetical protein